MPQMIAAIVFMTIFMLSMGNQFSLTLGKERQQEKTSMLEAAARQQIDFFRDCYQFMRGAAPPANGKYVQMSELIQANLVPSSSSAITPFGQTLQCWPVARASASDIVDVYVFPVGQYDLDAIERAGYGRYHDASSIPEAIYSSINQSIVNAMAVHAPETMRSINVDADLMAGTLTPSGGVMALSQMNATIIPDTSINPASMNDAPSAPAVTVTAPNQSGYVMVNYSVYGLSAPWTIAFPTEVNNDKVTKANYHMLVDAGNPFSTLRIEGWSPVCPAGGVILSESSSIHTLTRVLNNVGNSTQAGVLCLPAYKTSGAAMPVSAPAKIDYYVHKGYVGSLLSTPVKYTINNGGGAKSNEYAFYFPDGVHSQVNGLTKSSGNSFVSDGTTLASMTNLPMVNAKMVMGGGAIGRASSLFNGVPIVTPGFQNNFWVHTISVSSNSLSMNIVTQLPASSGLPKVVTFQIAIVQYQVPTGTGYQWSDMNLPKPSSSDSGSAYTGLDWDNGMSIYKGVQCPATSDVHFNLYKDCSLVTAPNTSRLTSGIALHVNAISGESLSGMSINDMTYIYNNGGSDKTKAFNFVIPASNMMNIHY